MKFLVSNKRKAVVEILVSVTILLVSYVLQGSSTSVL